MKRRIKQKTQQNSVVLKRINDVNGDWQLESHDQKIKQKKKTFIL